MKRNRSKLIKHLREARKIKKVLIKKRPRVTQICLAVARPRSRKRGWPS